MPGTADEARSVEKMTQSGAVRWFRSFVGACVA